MGYAREKRDEKYVIYYNTVTSLDKSMKSFYTSYCRFFEKP